MRSVRPSSFSPTSVAIRRRCSPAQAPRTTTSRASSLETGRPSASPATLPRPALPRPTRRSAGTTPPSSLSRPTRTSRSEASPRACSSRGATTAVRSGASRAPSSARRSRCRGIPEGATSTPHNFAPYLFLRGYLLLGAPSTPHSCSTRRGGCTASLWGALSGRGAIGGGQTCSARQ